MAMGRIFLFSQTFMSLKASRSSVIMQKYENNIPSFFTPESWPIGCDSDSVHNSPNTASLPLSVIRDSSFLDCVGKLWRYFDSVLPTEYFLFSIIRCFFVFLVQETKRLQNIFFNCFSLFVGWRIESDSPHFSTIYRKNFWPVKKYSFTGCCHA